MRNEMAELAELGYMRAGRVMRCAAWRRGLLHNLELSCGDYRKLAAGWRMDNRASSLPRPLRVDIGDLGDVPRGMKPAWKLG